MDEVYKHWLGIHYTAGVRWLAERAAGGNGAFWLIDAIASYQGQKKVKAEEFQLWRLVVHPDKSATLTMRPDSGKPAVVTQQIPWTDFDQDECELYVILTPGQRPLLLQPCEY